MMAWYDILVLIVGGFGGVSGLISIYNAKSNKTTIDIGNFKSLIDEERKERQELSKEYKTYKEVVERKVESVKREFEELRAENRRMIKAIYQAYRCNLPVKTTDCPVIKAFNEEHNCNSCLGKETIEDMDKI